MTENGLRGVEQGRALFAYESVKGIADQADEELKKKYKSVAKKIPVLIKTNGLAQTLAFMQNRDVGHVKLLTQMDTWLRQRQVAVSDQGEDLVHIVISAQSNAYRRLTTESLALLNWIRRFVDGLMADVKEERT